MKTLVHLTLLLWSLCASLPLLAQPQTFESGNMRWKMSPNGSFVSSGMWLEMKLDQEWLGFSYLPDLWLVGKNPNDWLALQKLGAGGEPRMAGSDYTLNKIWSVTANQVEQHLADWSDNGQIDNPIPSIFQWPGRGNIFFNAYNDMSLSPNDIEQLGAGFFDSNGTNQYNPSSGDYPILPLRNCNDAIVPSQMHYCVFTRPVGPYLEVPIPLEIHLYIFTFGCGNEHPLNQALFVYHQFIYTTKEDTPTGHPSFTDVYMGQKSSLFIGCSTDDYIGTFPDLNAMFVYNNQQNDCEGEPFPNPFDRFNGQAPSIGTQTLRAPINSDGQALDLSSSMYFNNPSVGNPNPNTTDPQTNQQYYNYLQGKWRDGTDLTYGGNGYGGTEPTNFVFPGLPEQPGGWTEWEELPEYTFDRRLLLNYGPFTLQPGAVNEVLTAYSYYRGPGSHLDQASGLYDQMALIQSFADACFIPENTPGFPECDALPVTAPQVEARQQELRVFPNPFVDWLTVELPEEAARYQVSLFDLQGRILWQAELASGQQRLQLPNLPAGLYLLRAQSGQSAPMVAKVVR
jgi:hypothetical protein